MATVSLTTIYILTMLGINKVLARDGICDDMMTDPKRIGHLNLKDTEVIKSACSGYAKRNLAARRFTVNRVHQKRLTLLIFGQGQAQTQRTNRVLHQTQWSHVERINRISTRKRVVQKGTEEERRSHDYRQLPSQARVSTKTGMLENWTKQTFGDVYRHKRLFIVICYLGVHYTWPQLTSNLVREGLLRCAT